MIEGVKSLFHHSSHTIFLAPFYLRNTHYTAFLQYFQCDYSESMSWYTINTERLQDKLATAEAQPTLCRVLTEGGASRTDLGCCWPGCASGGRAPWTRRCRRQASCSWARPSCFHAQRHLRRTGCPAAGSRAPPMGSRCRICRSVIQHNTTQQRLDWQQHAASSGGCES